MRYGVTPVPIPNTTVKTCTADGTMLETAWEVRWLPDFYKKLRAVQIVAKVAYLRRGLIAQLVRAHA